MPEKTPAPGAVEIEVTEGETPADETEEIEPEVPQNEPPADLGDVLKSTIIAEITGLASTPPDFSGNGEAGERRHRHLLAWVGAGQRFHETEAYHQRVPDVTHEVEATSTETADAADAAAKAGGENQE